MSARALPFPARKQEPEIEWSDYPRLQPGAYLGCCSWAGKYYDRQFQRWVCLLRWRVLTEDLQTIAQSIPQWFRLADGEKPRASRRGKYLSAWVAANNGRPPSRIDRLSPKIFTHRLAKVLVGDTRGPVPYSTIRKIISWETGPTATSGSPSVHQSG